MFAAVVSPLGLLLSLSLFLAVDGLLQCPDPPGWQVLAEGGGTGNRWKIPGDLTLIRTPLKKEDGSANGTWTHIAFNFTVTSAFDSEIMPCHGETITETPGNQTDSNPGEGYIHGTCDYAGTVMGAVDTAFEYNLDYRVADMYIYQDFTCNRTAKGRPWRVHADCVNKTIDIYCDDDGVTCGSPYPFDFGVYYVPLFPPPPLTNCSAGALAGDVPFIVRNISYNSVQSSEMAPVLGAAYVDLSMPLIDFTMRCLPSGDEMAWTYNGTSDTWYDCKADFTNPPDMPNTWIKFNHTTFEVTLVQEFKCEDGDKPQYVTARGAALIPRECAITYDGQDCWSTEVATIRATDVTSSDTQPAADALPPMLFSHAGAGASVAAASDRDAATQRLVLDMLVGKGVLSKENVRPDRLPAMLGDPI